MYTALATLFDTNVIYNGIYDLFFQYKYLIFIFFGISCMFRLSEEGMKNIGGKSNIPEAIKDATKAALIVFCYFSIALVICKFIIAVNHYVGDQGSLGVVLEKYKVIIEKVKAELHDASGAGEQIKNALFTLVDLPVKGFGALCFLVSYSLLMIIHYFLRYAYAVFFSFLVVWGGVAMATSPSKVLSLEGGFVTSLKALIIWPIVEGVFYSMAIKMIEAGGGALIVHLKTSNVATALMPEGPTLATAYLIFALVNIFLIAVVLSAGMVSMYLSMNQSALGGIIAPFSMGAIMSTSAVWSTIKSVGAPHVKAAGGMAASGLKNTGGKLGGALGKSMGNIITGYTNRGSGGSSPTKTPNSKK